MLYCVSYEINLCICFFINKKPVFLIKKLKKAGKIKKNQGIVKLLKKIPAFTGIF